MIYYPKVYGVCTGAYKAVDLAYKLNEQFKDKNIYIYKEVLHNEYIIDKLNKEGIKIVDNLDLVNKDDILIIRAHGETKETYEELKNRKITYYDATCVNVKRVQDIVEEKYNNGYKIIIVGKKNHPEVIATASRSDNTAIIIETKEDYDSLNKNDKYYVVCQTTTSQDSFNDLIDYLKKNNYNYEYKNTICNNQSLIQTSSALLARKMDVMFVIGGASSSNTKELFNKCKKVCKKTYFFSDIESFYDYIKTQKYSEKTKIGFTGGASTLKEQINEFSNLLEFIIYYKNAKKEIDKGLIRFNKDIKEDNNPIINDTLNKFKSSNSDGKCIRGTLIKLGYNTHKKDDYYLKLASAYEAFETAILIHDDIIDNSDLRRGKPTIHKQYQKSFSAYKNDNTPTSLALCIGDISFFIIYEYLLKNYKNDKNFTRLISYYNNILIDTVKGEILDVYLPFIEKNDRHHRLFEDDIMRIYKLKTSIYSIVGPFALGLILANSKNKEIKEFESVLEPIGISFQIKDDILGIFGNNIGKSVVSDIEEFKQTILYSYIKINKPEYLNALLTYYGTKTSTNDLNKVKEIFIKSGALKYAEDKMNELFDISKEKIENLEIKQDIKNILLGLIIFLRYRKK